MNFILLHIGVILSNNILVPAFGAFGCNRLAVVSFNSLLAIILAGTTLLIKDKIIAIIVLLK